MKKANDILDKFFTEEINNQYSNINKLNNYYIKILSKK